MNTTDKLDTQTIVEEKIVKLNGEIQIRKYQKSRLLGKGGFARCYEFINLETKEVTAAKIIPKKALVKSRAKQKLISEIKIHKSLHHPNIVSFVHYFEDTENVYLLIEICQNQTLNDLLKRRKKLTELEIQCYTIQLIKALKYLHSHRIIHRDLKLGNLFISDKMELKVGDFGLATKLEFDGERKRTVCGTPNYIAPEILEGKSGHSYEVDIWSLGVIIYTLIIGKPPFETNNVKETYKRIKMGNYNFPENALLSNPTREIIQRILVLDPNQRPSLDDILLSDFFNMGISIPKVMQHSTLACPPNLNYIKQFIPDVGNNGIVNNFISKGIKKNNINNSDINISNDNNKNESDRSKISNYKYDRNYSKNNHSRDIQILNYPEANGVYIKKWIDYSMKYGLGYILSNGHVGVYFNDSTKIIYKPNGANFIYIERKVDRNENISSHDFNENFNKDLNKKVILLNHFKSYLLEEAKNTIVEKKTSENIDENKFVYLKKWMKTKHSTLFRLSNKLVQVCFIDQTEIHLSSETKVVTYVNKRGERLTFHLANAFDSNNIEMIKRLRYTKQILMHMLTARTIQNNNVNNTQYTNSTTKAESMSHL